MSLTALTQAGEPLFVVRPRDAKCPLVQVLARSDARMIGSAANAKSPECLRDDRWLIPEVGVQSVPNKTFLVRSHCGKPGIVAQAFGTLAFCCRTESSCVGTGEHLNEGHLASRCRTTKSGSPACVRRSGSSPALDGAIRHFRRRVLPHSKRDDLRSPRAACSIYVGAGGPQVAKYAGRAGTASSALRQGNGAVLRTVARRSPMAQKNQVAIRATSIG